MPIGARPAGRIAIGPAITPVGIPAGTGADGDTTGPAVAAYFTDFRTDVLIATDGVAAMPLPAPGQYHEIERATVIDTTGTHMVLVTAAFEPGGAIFDAIQPTGTPGGIYVLDCASPIRQAEGVPVRFVAITAFGAIDTGAALAVTVQYRVLSVGAP